MAIYFGVATRQMSDAIEISHFRQLTPHTPQQQLSRSLPDELIRHHQLDLAASIGKI
jgi:hypothetical protein